MLDTFTTLERVVPLELLCLCMHVHVHVHVHAILRVLSPQLRMLDAQGVTPLPLQRLAPAIYPPWPPAVDGTPPLRHASSKT